MTQIFDERGDVHPVTVLKAGPCVITQLKTLAKDGYEAAQIGYVDFVKASKVNKAMTGHFAKSNVPPVRDDQGSRLEVGQGRRRRRSRRQGWRPHPGRHLQRRPSFVDVIGTSKGRGFAGVIRRHGFGGGPKSHGHMFQVQGSIGASSFPSRVFPGQRMPGHMGTTQITVRNLRIRGIDVEDNLLLVEGAVPGPRDGYVLISKAKAPPRERRGFAGAATKDALKASKKAAPSKKK